MQLAIRAAVILTGMALCAATGAAELPPGHEQIMRMAGCHSVSFRFYEDGVHGNFNEEGGLDLLTLNEQIGVVEQSPTRIVLQHAVVHPGGGLMPHWHEEWEYGEAGWTQTVYSSAHGNPQREQRYTCTAPWSMNRWQCATERATKPFRDDGAPFGFDRTDYEWLDRDNTLLVTPKGWVQSEHNQKTDAEGKPVSYEVGLIEYRKIESGECERSASAPQSE